MCSSDSLGGMSSVSRRHSVDGASHVDHFHPYLRQLSDGTSAAACVQPRSPPFGCGPELCRPHSSSWGCSNTVQSLYSVAPAVTTDVSFMSSDSSSLPSFNNISEVSSKPYGASHLSYSSKYSPQKFSSTCQESSPQFPKPIYSYSILIFMALKNSKTGSLPVSEIYSFMTEHFPYFKTAPDGWKNSVRHNLSLNKCFEKVENKNGSSSRKGCLWALNPAKVEKMQEELHKWRRKDPGTVRRSMAKPEELDRLLGEKPNKFRSLAHCAILPHQPHPYTSSSCYGPEQLRPLSSSSSQCYSESLYLSHSAPRPNHSFSLYPPCSGQHALAPRCLNFPAPGKMPPAYTTALAPQDGHSGRSMQDLLMEGDTGCDIDTLNPSLTDLQLQGNLWEELKVDSAASDPRVVHSCEQSNYMTPISPGSEGMACQDRAHYVERLWGLDQSSLNGQYSGAESVAGGLSSCATSVSLM